MAKWKGPEPRAYYGKYKKLDVQNGKGWFDCYALPGDVIAICEPQHLQEVNCFLIFGKRRVLMLDTGMGICDIRPLVEELCGDDFYGLQIVNCHAHFDHTGGNCRFREVMGADTAFSRRQAQTGVPHGPLASQSDEDMFLFDYPEGFRSDEYCVEPYAFKPLEDGQLFDLGDRTVEFITTPGHTEDHAMLYDHRDGILFAGDMIYFGAIYVQFNNNILGHSSIEDYIASLEKVKERCKGLQSVYVSHNDFITDSSAIDRIKEAMEAIADGRVEGEPLRDAMYGYFGDPPTMKQYFFDRFSIVADR